MRSSRSNRMLISMSFSGMSTIGRFGRTSRIAAWNDRPLVLAVEVVDDEEPAALQVFAQALELRAVRMPIAAAGLLQEQPRIVEQRVVRRAPRACCRARLGSASCARPRAGNAPPRADSRSPTTDCTSRASPRSPSRNTRAAPCGTPLAASRPTRAPASLAPELRARGAAGEAREPARAAARAFTRRGPPGSR